MNNEKSQYIITYTYINIFINWLCYKRNKDEKAPARLKEITGKIVKANTNNDGNIIIKENDITDTSILAINMKE